MLRLPLGIRATPTRPTRDRGGSVGRLDRNTGPVAAGSARSSLEKARQPTSTRTFPSIEPETKIETVHPTHEDRAVAGVHRSRAVAGIFWTSDHRSSCQRSRAWTGAQIRDAAALSTVSAQHSAGGGGTYRSTRCQQGGAMRRSEHVPRTQPELPPGEVRIHLPELRREQVVDTARVLPVVIHQV
jgi:hypothetical protein